MQQRTIKTRMFAKAKAAISGRLVSLTVEAANANRGIVFVRSDLPSMPEVLVNPETACLREYSIDLVNSQTTVYGVEAILAALYGLGIDNVKIKLDGAEIPRMLNGVASWVFLLQAAGIRDLAQKRNTISVKEPMLVRSGKEWVRLYPHDGFRLSIHKQRESKAVNLINASRVVDFSEAVFVSDLCYTDLNVLPEEHFDNARKALNRHAKHNIERHQTHLQLNSSIVRFLALCSLTGAEIKALYVKFGQSIESDFLAVKALYNELHSVEDSTQQIDGKKVAFIA